MGLGDEAFARRDMCEDAAHDLWACSDYAILHKGTLPCFTKLVKCWLIDAI